MFTKENLYKNTENLDTNGNVRIDMTIVCKERNSEYRYHNRLQKHVAKIKIDGGLISNDQERCDWLLINWDDGILFFIELKGSDLWKAVSQIQTTIDTVKTNMLQQFSFKNINVRIILSKNQRPDYKNDARYKKLEQLIKEKIGNIRNGNIRIESRQMQENC
ncbi:MAG: hypothetical protein LBG58_12815 [Planctomycetaceae bacterium]|jgi:hypothetical protein|nr:hypothetical protein [Planctomycetaceae bacterium]